jgi:hypothetical protein
MSRLLAILVMVLLMTVVVSSGAFAQEEEIVPGGGNAFGEHVSGMAPEHPMDHGQGFGKCVSTMAQTGTCPHHS